MVVRYAPDPDSSTSAFKVFRAVGPQQPEDDGSGGAVGYLYSWRKLDTLGGRMLFVGRGCSKSYETADYPGFEDGVYFSDDRSFYNDDIVIFGGVREYSCSDNGKWSEGPPSNVMLFFPENGPSRLSSPTWVLLNPPPMSTIGDLPAHVLYEIIDRVPCEVDRARLPEVCRDWRALGKLELPPRLPWLVRPVAGGPELSCLLCGAEEIHHWRAPDEVRGARCFGSYDGRYIFVAHGGARGNILLNLRIGEPRVLPDYAVMRPSSRLYDSTTYPVVMIAATLSSEPEQDGCVGAAIVYGEPGAPNQRRLCFWRDGDSHAVDPHVLFDGKMKKAEVEDIIHFDGAFYLLTPAEYVYEMKPVLLPNGELKIEAGHIFYFATPNHYDREVIGRYLVESRGELLMIVKLSEAESPGQTGSFKVFRMRPLKTITETMIVVSCVWEEVLEMDRRIFFTARASSRAYELANFPSLLHLEDAIYFLDDLHESHQIQAFPCRDMGKWTMMPPIVRHCFPPEVQDSDFSPLAWLLP
jgi:hypothetical protein